jgi:hypothetical protein
MEDIKAEVLTLAKAIQNMAAKIENLTARIDLEQKDLNVTQDEIDSWIFCLQDNYEEELKNNVCGIEVNVNEYGTQVEVNHEMDLDSRSFKRLLDEMACEFIEHVKDLRIDKKLSEQEDTNNG